MVYAIEAFETRVAMLRLTDAGPKLLLAENLHGEQPVPIYRVSDLVEIRRLRARGLTKL